MSTSKRAGARTSIALYDRLVVVRNGIARARNA